MRLELRIFLIVLSVLTCVVVLRKVRRSQMDISDSIFWIICSIGVALLSIFSDVAGFFSKLLGFASPSNFVFLVAIAVVIIKLFFLSIQMSQQKHKLRLLIEETALRIKAQEEKQAADKKEDAQ